MRNTFKLFTPICFVLFAYNTILAQSNTKTIHHIRNEFKVGSDDARTKLWWFHGETETTKEGISADLEAFKKVGVGGVVYYDQLHGDGKNALKSFSKEWWDMFRFAASEAKRLGLTFETHLSDGYVSGGPWITEDLSMQRLDAVDTLIKGNQHFQAKLPVLHFKNKTQKMKDVAVLAFPVPVGYGESSLSLHPEITSNLKNLDVNAIVYPVGEKLISVPLQGKGSPVFINFSFKKIFTARSITYSVRPQGKSRTGAMNMPGPSTDKFYGYAFVERPFIGQLEASQDGVRYFKVCDLKPMYETPTWSQRTISFKDVKAKYFRLHLHDWSIPKDMIKDLQIGSVIISSQAKIDQWEEKAALNSEYIEKDETPIYKNSTIIDSDKILNITSKLGDDGHLDWEVPSGRWVIMRFVRVPVGVKTKHGRSNFKGLESDKLSSKASVVQWNSYFKVMRDSLAKSGIELNGLHMDSHEAGSQNWTPGFENKFKQLRSYDLIKYLPAFKGYIVGSKEETDGFLYDMRLTLSDLVSDEYFSTLDSLCQKSGVNFTAQAVGNGITMVADNFKAKGRVQKPQGEFWGYQTHGSYDVKETSSAAHIYGKPIASAEAFTDMKFSQSLAEMKNVADYAFAFGSQEFVVCASAYQPWLNKIPGSTGGGRQYVLNRNNTFWDYSRPFWDYQARCAGLMRNGISVADLCIYLGENAPVKLMANRLPVIPEGFDFDVCTKDALISRMSAKDGQIILPDGVSYKMLVLQRNGDISLDALRKIAQLVREGVPVYGPRPTGSGSLKDLQFADEYRELVNQMWGSSESGVKNYGNGKVYWGYTLAEAIEKHKIQPDAKFKSANIPTDKLYFAHRRLEKGDIYFLNNHSENIFNDTIRFRTSATNAEYWDPTTGLQYKIPLNKSGDNEQSVFVFLQPNESGFIVMNNDLTTSLPLKKNPQDDVITKIEGAWNVFFDPKWGGPGNVIFSELTDWSLNNDKRIKYYSGTAVYNKSIQLPKSNVGEQILLRFPQLGSIARVIMNGKEVSTVWCSPWETDITSYIKEGENNLQIYVVNSLVNRMVGDVSLPVSERFTFSYPEIVTANSSLVASGIMNELLLVKRNF